MTSVSEIIHQSGVGSSEIAGVVGLSPFVDRWQIFARKKGLIENEQSEEMLWGIELEPVIVKVFAERMGLPVERCNRRIYSKTRPWQYASPDAFILTDPRQLLEAKTASLRHAGEWDRHADNEDGVPDYYHAQVQWQLTTLELETAYIAVLIAGNDFRVYRIQHDPVLEEILLEEGEKFWREHLMANQAPPIGGSERARQYLRQRYPRQREQLRRATLEEMEWLREYAAVRAELDAIQSRKDELENQLTEAVGAAEGLSWPGGKFTWKRSKDYPKVNWQGLAESQLVGYAEDEKAALLAQYTETVHGTRRIHFSTGAAE